jgi:hypothetical protein
LANGWHAGTKDNRSQTQGAIESRDKRKPGGGCMNDLLYEVRERGRIYSSHSHLFGAAFMWEQNFVHREVWSRSLESQGFNRAEQILVQTLHQTIRLYRGKGMAVSTSSKEKA